MPSTRRMKAKASLAKEMDTLFDNDIIDEFIGDGNSILQQENLKTL